MATKTSKKSVVKKGNSKKKVKDLKAKKDVVGGQIKYSQPPDPD